MKKILLFTATFVLCSCASVVVPIENFQINLVEVRDLNVNKIKYAPTNTLFNNSGNSKKELVFSTNLNIAKLILNGYSGVGYINYGKIKDLCYIYDETIPAPGAHISLSDMQLKSHQYIENYLKKLDDKKVHKYSCVVDTAKISNHKLNLHIELAYFMFYTKYVSNTLEINIEKANQKAR